MKLKHFATSTAGGTPDTSNVAFWSDDEAGTPWVAIGDMSGRDLVTVTQKKLTTAGLLDRRLRPAPAGTVLFAMYASVGEVSTLAIPAVWNQAILGLTPLTGMADSRFLAYWLRHFAPQAIAQANSATQANLGADQVMNFPFPDLTIPGQRRIADFLDDRVARIDQIIAARQQQSSHAADLRWYGLLSHLHGKPTIALRRLIASLADGPFGSAFSSDDYTDDGPAVVRLGNIGFDAFRPAEIARVPSEIYERFPRCHIRQGDLLIASLGDSSNHAGRACLAPEDLGPAMAKGKTFVARANTDTAQPRFLSALLSSPAGATALGSEGTGATRNMLNFERLLATEVPLLTIQEQVAAIRDYTKTADEADGLLAAYNRSITLLQEYKQSLITAAVTGEFDVTTASTKIPE